MNDRNRQRERVVRKTRANVRQARRKLLAQHHKLATIRERNRQRENGRRGDRSDGADGSRHSTVPDTETNEQTLAGTENHSTVPTRPRGSDVPADERLYGLRLRRRARE